MTDREARAGSPEVLSALGRYLDQGTKRGRATEAVTEAMREAILDGVLAPNMWLREDEIARALKVSRTPVREALRRLADEGLTIKRAHMGTVVAPLSNEDVLALYVVRENLEGLAARLAARTTRPMLVERLTRLNDEMRAAAAAGEASLLVDLNLQFHRALREASANAYLDRFLMQVEHAVRRLGSSTFGTPGRGDDVVAEHDRIISAIAAGDGQAAEDAAKAHMKAAREIRMRALLGL